MGSVYPTDVQQFLAQELAAGRYHSESELVVEAVRKLRDERENARQFRAQLQQRIAGLDRGEGIKVNDDQALAALLDQIDREVDAENAAN
jgi:Arc/MetJ-type ribon-helix-helix transcriptional regulator